VVDRERHEGVLECRIYQSQQSSEIEYEGFGAHPPRDLAENDFSAHLGFRIS